MYDLIGDIHGHADELLDLLENQLEYKKKGGVYSHSKRRAIFLGDFIDKGPKIREVLEIVQPMIEFGGAMAVMGNHEFNALAWATEGPDGEPLRPHTADKEKQHEETLKQLGKEDLEKYCKWFRTLRMWREEKDNKGNRLRIVHACWDENRMKIIGEDWKPKKGVTTPFLIKANNKEGELHKAVEDVLKGPELPLPPGKGFKDRYGKRREEIRIKWYREPKFHEKETYAEYSLSACKKDSSSPPIHRDHYKDNIRVRPCPADAPPVFIGHYWLRGKPDRLAVNVACVDYSIADTKLEKEYRLLCAYRWAGEQRLKKGNFVSVPLGSD